MTIGILNSQADLEAKLFAATTLRGKVGGMGSLGYIPCANLLDNL